MELEKTLKLIEAGFTAEEIRAMHKPAEAPNAEPEEKPKEVQKDKTKEDAGIKTSKEESPENEINKAIKAEIEEIKKDFEALKRVFNPSIGSVSPVGIDDVIAKFFTEE